MNEVVAILTIQLEGRFRMVGDGVARRKKTKKVSYDDIKIFSSTTGAPKPIKLKGNTITARVPVKQKRRKLFYDEAVKVVKLTQEQIDFFESKDSCPDKKNVRLKNTAYHWKRMKPAERLRFHLSELAEGKEFKIDFL